MQKEKWIYDGNEIEVPIVDKDDIEHNIDSNLEDTTKLNLNYNNDNNLENTKRIEIVGEDYNE